MSYIDRQANQDLLDNLTHGKHCHILSPFQTGKTELLNKTKGGLERDDFVCGVIDLQAIEEYKNSENQWFQALIQQVIQAFEAFLRNNNLSNFQTNFSQFIENTLLTEIDTNRKIVIFFDNVDSILKPESFKISFLAAIKNCHQQRSSSANYQRLTFALFGTAIASDFIVNTRDILSLINSESIQLDNFQFNNLKDSEKDNLAHGCEDQLKEIFDWSGGHPSLTQFICELVRNDNGNSPVEQIIRSKIINNWQTEEGKNRTSLKHISIIAEKLKSNQELLKIYQQVYELDVIEFNNSPEQQRLIMLGIVKQQGNKLVVSNLLYHEIFNQGWIQQNCFYSVTVNSNTPQRSQQSNNWLLRITLLAAVLTAIQDLFSNTIQPWIVAIIALLKITQIKVFLGKLLSRFANFVNNLFTRIGEVLNIRTPLVRILFIISTILLLVILTIWKSYSDVSGKGIDLEKEADKAQLFFKDEHQQLKALKKAVIVGEATKDLRNSPKYQLSKLLDYQLPTKPYYVLQTILDEIIEKNQFTDQDHKFKEFWKVAFSPDGKKFAVTGARQDSDGWFQLWVKSDGHKWKQIKTEQIDSKTTIYGLSFDPDGTHLAIGDRKGLVEIWELDENGNSLSKVDSWESYDDDQNKWINSLHFNSDRQHIAVASKNGIVKLATLKDFNIDRESAKEIPHQFEVKNLNFIKINYYNSELLATVGNDGYLRFWDFEGKLKGANKVSQKRLNSIDYHQKRKKVAVAGEEEKVIVGSLSVDTNQNRPISFTKENTFNVDNTINSLSFAPQGNLLVAAGNNGTLKIWDLLNQNQDPISLKTYGSQEIKSISFNPKTIQSDPNELITVANDPIIRMWEIKEPESQNITSNHQKKIISLSVRSNKKEENNLMFLATVTEDGIAKINDTEKDELNEISNNISTVHGDSKITSVSFSHDSDYLAVGDDNGLITFWNKSGKELVSRHLKTKQGEITSIIFDPEDEIIAVAGQNATVETWNWTKGKREGKKPLSHNDNVTKISFSPDSQYLATLNSTGKVKLWNLKTQKEVRELSSVGSITDFSFSPDNKYIATVGKADGKVLLWTLVDGEKYTDVKTDLEGLTTVDFNLEKSLFTVGGINGSVKVYRWSKNVPEKFNEQILAEFHKNPSQITTLSFSPDGKYIVAAYENGEIETWKIKELGKLVQEGCEWLAEYHAVHTNTQSAKACKHIS